MKKIYVLLACLMAGSSVIAQDFNQYAASAKSAYSGGQLEESRFAMQQMLVELDKKIGNELLKILPAKLETLSSNQSGDEVSGSSSFAGVVIKRQYTEGDKSAELEIITNSPLVTSLNAILSLPAIVGNSTDQRRIKVANYKGLITGETDTDTPAYNAQLPFGSTLLSLRTKGFTEEEATKLVNALPVAEIVKMLQ